MSIDLHGHQQICAELMQLTTDLKTMSPSHCRSCKAYKRGREDAAKAVEQLSIDFGDSDWQLTVHASAVAYGIEMALAAARGGEQ